MLLESRKLLHLLAKVTHEQNAKVCKTTWFRRVATTSLQTCLVFLPYQIISLSLRSADIIITVAMGHWSIPNECYTYTGSGEDRGKVLVTSAEESSFVSWLFTGDVLTPPAALKTMCPRHNIPGGAPVENTGEHNHAARFQFAVPNDLAINTHSMHYWHCSFIAGLSDLPSPAVPLNCLLIRT